MNKSFIKNHINVHKKNQETQTWLNDINIPESKRGNGRIKLRTYKLFKQTYSEEIYVKLMQRSHRSSFAKFRMGVAPLRIETERCERIAEVNRVCFKCNDAVESEEHVFMDCRLYQDLREVLFSKITNYIPDFLSKTNQEKLICIFSSDIIPVIRISAKISNDILNTRRSFLYK